MGCSFCRGHAGQVCSRPDCRDETKDIVEEKRSLAPILVCGHCRQSLLPVTDGSWICVTHGVQGRKP